MKIPLPEPNFEAQIFDAQIGDFVAVIHDILETKHKDNVGSVSTDYTLYLKIKVNAG